MLSSNSISNTTGKIIEEKGIFKLVDSEQGFFLALGKNRITNIYKTKEELENIINIFTNEQWEVLLVIIGVMVETHLEIINNK